MSGGRVGVQKGAALHCSERPRAVGAAVVGGSLRPAQLVRAMSSLRVTMLMRSDVSVALPATVGIEI